MSNCLNGKGGEGGSIFGTKGRTRKTSLKVDNLPPWPVNLPVIFEWSCNFYRTLSGDKDTEPTQESCVLLLCSRVIGHLDCLILVSESMWLSESQLLEWRSKVEESADKWKVHFLWKTQHKTHLFKRVPKLQVQLIQKLVFCLSLTDCLVHSLTLLRVHILSLCLHRCVNVTWIVAIVMSQVGLAVGKTTISVEQESLVVKRLVCSPVDRLQ